MIAQAGGDPWMGAWRKLKAFIESGATEQEITEYARELGLGLPSQVRVDRAGGCYRDLDHEGPDVVQAPIAGWSARQLL